MNWSKLTLFFAGIATLVSPVFITLSSASAASGEFSGSWLITRDVSLDGSVNPGGTASNYYLNLNSHGNTFAGNYTGIDNDSIFEGETYHDPARSGKIIEFRQRDEAYYVVHSGKWISANKYQGTWYDNAGNSGDFLLQKQ